MRKEISGHIGKSLIGLTSVPQFWNDARLLWILRLPWSAWSSGGLLRLADYFSISYKNIPTNDGARRDHLWLLHNNISGVGDAQGDAQQITLDIFVDQPRAGGSLDYISPLDSTTSTNITVRYRHPSY